MPGLMDIRKGRTPIYSMPDNRAPAISPTLRAGQMTLGHRYRGKVTVVVDVMCVEDFVLRGEDADRLLDWIQTSVLTRMHASAWLEVIHR